MSAIHLTPPNRSQASGRHYKSTSAYEEKALVRTGAGVVNQIYVRNKNATKRYLWVYDGISTAGTQLLPPLPIPATDGYASFDSMYGLPFATGLYFAVSTTDATYTATTTDDINISISYSVDSTTALP